MPAADEATGPLALIVEPDGTRRTERLPDGDLAGADRLHELVGGWIEAIGMLGSWVAYLNEDGKRPTLRQPPNRVAEAIAVGMGWRPVPGDYLAGTVVFLGAEGTNESDVPEMILRAASVVLERRLRQ